MIQRNVYLEYIMQFLNKPQIKIITGIRRSGKSTILQLLHQELRNLKVDESQIIAINFESLNYADYTSAAKLHQFVSERITTQGKYYLLLDEIQEVQNWEKAINSFLVDFDVDIYLTGSNSHLLSSELATYIAGRYIQIPIFTLSFSEYLDFKLHYSEPNKDQFKAFIEYLRLGGFPVIHTLNYSADQAYKVVRDIYSSVILKDSVQRYSIRNVEILERIIKYVFDNIGNTFSGKNVADYFKNQQRKIDLNTVYNYLKALEGAYLIYRVSRYDIKGKEILKTQEKFFVSDVSLIYAKMGYRDNMIGGILENLVFLELIRREYQVYIGKLGDKEIDFIAEKQGQKMYIQVAYKLESEATVNREFDPLLAISDQYPKYVITMDEFWKGNIQGVQHVHISDFLLNNFL